MEINKIYQKLTKHFGSDVILGLTEAEEGVCDLFILVEGRRIDKVCLYCRSEAVLAFDFCQSITGMDTGETLTCVYHLFSYRHKHTLILKATTSRSAAKLPSSVVAWPVADWYEREIYDLFGIDFEGHPDLRRLLLPEDWDGHPMLKGWQEKPLYNGIPTTRENPLDLLEEDS